MRKIVVENENGDNREYLVPQGTAPPRPGGRLRVRAGDRLTEGPINPHDILRIKGIKEAQEYLVDEIQEVYRLQGVRIDDKHIETIVRQMLQKVRIEDPGDSPLFLEGDQVDKVMLREENERIEREGGQPATFTPLLLGITKASLSTQSFISAASFQETTRILTEAAIRGSVDGLRGSQGERDHREPHPGRNRALAVQEPAGLRGRRGSPGAAGAGDPGGGEPPDGLTAPGRSGTERA